MIVRSGMRMELSPNEYGASFACVARCPCGRDVQLGHEWIKLASMYGQELERERARLKCRKCGARSPRVEVYRVPA
jgi:hypothetical protein